MRQLSAGVTAIALLGLVSHAPGMVTLGLSDSDGLLTDRSTIAGPGQTFVVSVDLGITGGETVGGVTIIPQANVSDALSMVGRTIMSDVLVDPTADVLASPELSPQSSIDVGVTTASVDVGATQSHSLMLLMFMVDAATPVSSYPLKVSFAKARWATTGANSVGTFANEGEAYTVYLPGQAPPVIATAESRKIHGALGNFSVPLTLAGNTAVECRVGGPTQIVISYDKAIGGSPVVGLSAGVLGAVAVSANQLTINLSGVPDGSCLTLTLTGVADAAVPALVAPEHAIKLAALMGDINGNRIVNVADIGLVKARSNIPVEAATFRTDLNANGSTNVADIGLVKSRSNVLPQVVCGY